MRRVCCTDCGLKTRRWAEVIPSLRNMVEAAAIMRARVDSASNGGAAASGKDGVPIVRWGSGGKETAAVAAKTAAVGGAPAASCTSGCCQ